MIDLQENLVVDWADCSLVEVNPLKLSGTPVLKGSRMPADGIIENYAGGLSAAEIAEIFELSESGVRGLLAYAIAQKPALQR